MARSIDTKTARRDLIRLIDGLEFYRSWVIAAIERENGAVTQADLDQIVMPGSDFLAIFDRTKGHRCVEILNDVQQWYAHTASDFVALAQQGDRTKRADIAQFLTDFQRVVGFGFLSEAIVLRQAVDSALMQGGVADHAAYYALKELENDLSQSTASTAEMGGVSGHLRDFESNEAK